MFFLDLINGNKIHIREINWEKNLILSIETKIYGFKEIYSLGIELLKRKYSDKEIIDILKMIINELEKDNINMKKNIDDKNQNINKLENEIKEKTQNNNSLEEEIKNNKKIIDSKVKQINILNNEMQKKKKK